MENTDSIPAKKSLGQNFLKNQAILKKISEKAREILKENQKKHKKEIKILEIGPGKGALTAHLLNLEHPVVAIEADHRLIPHLEETFKDHLKRGDLTLIHQDIREFEVASMEDPYIVVANIPYYLTGYILRQFLESDHQPLAMIVMIQKEVALRIVDKKQTLLSLGVSTYGTATILSHVSKGNFNPPPKVDSSILVIDHISKKIFKDAKTEELYWNLAKKAFNSKRKQIGGTVLKEYKKEKAANLDAFYTRRPESLSPTDWLNIISIIS